MGEKLFDLTTAEQMEVFRQEKEWETGQEVAEVDVQEFEFWKFFRMLEEIEEIA
jgi:nucleoid-associated protein YgaU